MVGSDQKADETAAVTVAGTGDVDEGVRDASFRRALADLRVAQKTPQGVSAYSVRVNRPAGRLVAAAASVAGMRPNQLSLLSGLSSFAGVLMLVTASPGVPAALLIAAALAFGFVLDSSDGQLARVSGRCSPAGEWLDHMIDAATKLALHAGVLVSWYATGAADELPGGSRILLLPMIFQFVTLLLFFGGTLAPLLGGQATRRGAWPRGLMPPRSGLFLLPVDHGILCCCFLLWGWQRGFAVAYAVLCLAHATYLVTLGSSWFRMLSGSSAAGADLRAA